MGVFKPTKLVAPVAGPVRNVVTKYGRYAFDQDFAYPDGHSEEFALWGCDAVVGRVLPVTTDGKVVSIRLFSHGQNEFLIEFPGGRKKKDQSIEETIVAELEEETGYRPGELIHLGEPIVNNRTIRGAGGAMIPFLALNCTKDCEPHPDRGEVLEVLECTMSDWLRAIESGEVYDGQSMSLTLLALPHLSFLPNWQIRS